MKRNLTPQGELKARHSPIPGPGPANWGSTLARWRLAGTSLVETVLAIAMVGFLLAGTLVSLSGLRATAHCVAMTKHLQQIGQAIELYYNKYHCYPSAYPLKAALAEFIAADGLWADPADRTKRDIVSPTYQSPGTGGFAGSILGTPCGDSKYVIVRPGGAIKVYGVTSACSDSGSPGFAMYVGDLVLDARATVNGDIFSSGGVRVGAMTRVFGDATLAKTVTGKVKNLTVDGTLKTNAVIPPIIVDTSAIGRTNSTSHQESAVNTNELNLGDGGVHIFPNGLSTRGGVIEGSGTIIVYGDANFETPINGNFNIIVLGGGNLSAKQNFQVSGLVYATGSLAFSARVGITGMVVANGTLSVLDSSAAAIFTSDPGVLAANPPPADIFYVQSS